MPSASTPHEVDNRGQTPIIHAMRIHLSLPSVLALAIPLAGQNKFVSPVLAATVEGNNENLFPFANAAVPHYMELHGDLGPAPKLIQKLAFRMNAGDTNLYQGVNAIDLELFMGHGLKATQPSWFFAKNYVAPRTNVIARKVVNFGPQGQNLVSGPNPFTSNMNLVLDQPWLYSGSTAGSLVWESLVYSNMTTGGTFQRFDVDASSRTNTTSAVTGAGCTATGQATPMAHAVSMADMGGTLLFQITMTFGPANAAAYAALGASNPNVSIPGLCSALQTSLELVWPIGTTDASGAISYHLGGLTSMALPNVAPGGTVYTQVHCIDAGRSDPIAVCNSHGRRVAIPTSDTSHVVEATRLFSQLGGTGATESLFFFGSIVGYALVTEFTY